MSTPQPVKGVLALRRITNRQVAASFDPPITEHYVGRVLNGQENPSPRFRLALACLLGMPEEALFRSRDKHKVGAA